MRKVLNPHQKAKIALEAMKAEKTFAQLASEYQVHPSQISDWKQTLEKQAHLLFGKEGQTKQEEKIAALERMVGQREAELDWIKKKLQPFGLPDQKKFNPTFSS